jgi:hypothetical protein
MKITKQQLKQIIKEEIEAALKLDEDEGLPKRKPEHVDYDEGHADGFEGKPKQKGRSKEYAVGFKDGKATDKEYRDVTGDKL